MTEGAAGGAPTPLEALAERERQLRIMIGNVPGAVYRSETTHPWRDLFVSDFVHELCGYTAEELTRPGGVAFGDLILPDDRGIVEASVAAADGDDGKFEIQYRIRHADGSVRWVHDRGRVIYDDAGVPRWLEGVILDITEQKQIEVALRESEHRFRTLVANAPGTVYRSEVHHPFRDSFLSEGTLALTGYPSEEFMRPGGLTFGDLTHPDDRDAVIATVESAIAGTATFGVRYRLQHRDGSIRWVHDQGRVHFGEDRTPLWLDGLVVDITDRAHAEEALRESEARYRTIVASVPGAVFLCQPDLPWRNLFMSDGAEVLTGYPASAFAGAEGTLFTSITHPEDIGPITRATQAAITHGTPWAVRYRIRHASGEQRWVYEGGQAAYDSEGRPRFLGGVILDITERMRAEEANSALEAQLRQAQKMEAIGTLAGGIAHDFNNILGAVIGHAEILAADLPAQHTGQENIGGILAACRRARDLVQQILTFSRLPEQARRLIPLQPVVVEALKLLRPSLPASIEIRSLVSDDDFRVLADPGQVHQVLLNLCTNAAHAMRERDGVLEVRYDRMVADEALARQQVGLRAGAAYARLSVRDTGHGIPPQLIDRIFDPFFTTKPPGEGTGLGLAVVHGIMQSHEGAVTVASTVGAGTTFTLYFPVVTSDTPPQPAEPARTPRENGEHVMVVDDEADLARIARRIMERLGYKVTAHTRPADALTDFLTRPGEFDLVFTDLTMPGMSGIELATRMLAERPQLPVLLTSGYSGALEPEEFRRLGIRELVGKPFLSATIAEALRRALA